MIGWCSRTMAEYGNSGTGGAGPHGRIHADPTCKSAPDPTVLVEIWDGLLFPSSKQSKGVRVSWCAMCRRPEMPGDWSRRGACVGADLDLFFPQPGRGPSAAFLYRQAKAICDSCKVVGECREFAVKHEPGFGMWGGLSPKGRERVRLAMRQDTASMDG